MTNNNKYEIVIGLEVHAQLNTCTKIFAADETAYGAEPNTQISPITLGLPGVLPNDKGHQCLSSCNQVFWQGGLQ